MAKAEASGTVTAFRHSKFKQDSYQTIVALAKPERAAELLGARVVWARKDFIDKALEKAGWSPILGFSPRAAIEDGAAEEHPTASGAADYVLFRKSRPLAVVEGKKLAVSPQNVLEQAERYARTFQGGPFHFGPYRIPFAYSTNGMVFWFRDLRQAGSRSRVVSGFQYS